MVIEFHPSYQTLSAAMIKTFFTLLQRTFKAFFSKRKNDPRPRWRPEFIDTLGGTPLTDLVF